MVKKNFRPDPELEGKPLQMPEGIYDRGAFILSQLRQSGEIQNPENYMNMILNWSIGGFSDWIFEFNDKLNLRKSLYGLLNVDDCKYGYNCPETLTQLIDKGNYYDIVVENKILKFNEYYKEEVIESGLIDLTRLGNNTLNNNKIKNAEIIFEETSEEYYLVISFEPKLISNPNYTGEPEGYDVEGNAITYIDLADYPPEFVPDGYDNNDKPYLIIPDFEKQYNEIQINPISFEVISLDEYYMSFPDNYPFERLENEDGECILDEDAHRITTRMLDEFGREYGVDRLPYESNKAFLHRLLAYTQDVSSICGFRKYVCEFLKLTDSDIETEHIFTRLKVFETTSRYGEEEDKISSFAINRITTDNHKDQNDDEADIAVARDSPQISNQLLLKLTIPCDFDLKWVYNNLIELMPIGQLLEVWDKCGNHYPNIFNFDLLLCTNLHLLTGHKFLLNDEEQEINDQSKFISLNNEGDTFNFKVPGYHKDGSLLGDNSGYFEHEEYISRDIEGAMMVNPKESFVLQLLMKAIKKNEYMFHDI